MSNRKRKAKKKFQKTAKPRPVTSQQQQLRLQQAIQAQSAGNLALAEAEYRSLIAAGVRIPGLFSNLAMICDQTDRRKEAQALWNKALSLDSGFLDARMQLANSYQKTGEIERSMEIYRRILSEQPRSVVPKYLLANLLKSQGRFEQATIHYEQIMAQQPDYTQAHFSYSGIHRYQDRSDPHIGRMIELYQTGKLQDDNRIQLAFALAKAFEDLEDYPQAFDYLEAGNDLRYGKYDYTIESDEALFESIIQTFTREAMSRLQVAAESSDKPIFIVGMPRSGTSLVEKILSSHSDVVAGEELDYFFALGTSLFPGKVNRGLFDPLDSYPQQSFETLGRAYLEKINLLDSQAHHITDKLPFNLMMIGLIKIVLPNAKIIHCVRDARDTCLSIYKQNFTSGNYRFAYKLKTLGQFHNLYQKLMEHWHQTIPGGIYDISYESLTQNPEQEIRQLLSACNLEWQEDCLNFEKSPATVTTASFYQVRQPMYTSSVKLWQKYGAFLKPLLDELNEG